MNRTSRIAVAVALCAAGSVLPASAAGHKSPAYYKMVKAKADGTYTFTEQNNYDSGGRETTTIKVEFSGKGGKLYLGPGDAYGWNKAANGPVTISYSVEGSIPAVSWNPCTGQTWEETGTFTGHADIGMSGPVRDFGKMGAGRKIKLKDKNVTVAVEGYVPVTKVTKRLDSFGGCHTETDTEESSQYVTAMLKGKLKGSKVRLSAVAPDDPGVDNITVTANGEGTVTFNRNPALRW